MNFIIPSTHLGAGLGPATIPRSQETETRPHVGVGIRVVDLETFYSLLTSAAMTC